MAGKAQAIKQSTAQVLDDDIAEIIRQATLQGVSAEQTGVAPIQESGVTIAPTTSTEVGYTSESIPAPTPMQQSIEGMTGVTQEDPWMDPAQSELRQQGLEGPQSFQQLLDMDLENEQRRMASADLYKAFGELGGQEYIDGLVRLRDYDIANTARKEHTQESLAALQGIAEETEGALKEAIEDGPTLDAEGKYAFDQSALLLSPVGLKAGVRTGDAKKPYRVDPDFIMSTMMAVEPMMAMSQREELLSENMKEAMTRDDLDDLGLKFMVDEEQVKSLEQLGKLIQANWEMAKQVREKGPEIVADPKAGTKLSSEAYSQLGLMGQAMYAAAFPGVLERVDAKDGGSFYQVTPAGQRILNVKAKRVAPPKFHAPPVVGATDPKGQAQYTAQTRGVTGTQIRPAKGKAENKIVTATKYYSQQRHMADPMRANMTMAFGAMAMKRAANTYFDRENPHLDYIADFFGVGEERVQKIRNAHVAASNKLAEINKKLEKAQGERNDFLQRKADALVEFVKESQTLRWQEGMYKLYATRQLEMLNDIATYKYDNVSFTFARQLANTRLTIQQTRMNPQAHKVARNVFGSTSIYNVKPGSNNDVEFAVLVSFGATLFNQANLNYEKSFDRMKKRVASVGTLTGDPQMEQVYIAGKELAEIFGDYDPTSTMESLGALTATEAGVDGVQSVLQDGGVSKVEEALGGASNELKNFLSSAGEHADEFVSILEHAVEFSKYIDSHKSGKPYMSSMRPIEVDGISNGLAALLAILGEHAPMYRVGVLQQDPNRILSGHGGIEGDLRDLFKHNLQHNMHNYLNDNEFLKQHRLKDEELELVSEAMGIASGDKKNFLKPPLMTLPYGQAVASMIGQAYATILNSDRLQGIAKEMGGQDRLAGILHGILGGELSSTLGPNVSTYIESLQDMMGRTTLLGQPLVYKQAVGTMTSVSDTAFRQKKMSAPTRTTMRPLTTEGEYLTPKEGGPQAVHEGQEAFTATITSKGEAFTTAAAPKGGIPGAAVRSAAAPQVVIGLDGATLIDLVTGRALAKMRKELGGDPYVLPIFDAILTDLGSFRTITNQINDVWFDLVMNYDLIGELINGFERAQTQGTAKWDKKVKGNPKGLVKDKDHARYVYSILVKTLNTINGRDSLTKTQILENLKPNEVNMLKLIQSDLGKKKRAAGNKGEPSDYINNKHMLFLIRILQNADTNYSEAMQNMKQIHKASLEGKRKIVKDMKKSSQYHADNVKMKYKYN